MVPNTNNTNKTNTTNRVVSDSSNLLKNTGQKLNNESNDSNNKLNTFHLSEFKTTRRLGAGRFGKVVLASTTIDHHFNSVVKRDGRYYYAIKILNNNKFDKVIYNLSNANYINKINNEIKIMNYLNKYNHPNILVLYSIINNEISNLKINKFYFIMEFCELGELTLNNFAKLPYDSKYPMFNIQHKLRDIIKGVEFLHLNQIIHRDIKPSNFLIDSRGTVKISDLGVCYKLTGDLKDNLSELKNPVGTPLFFPPEICYNNASNVAAMESNKSSFLLKPKLFQNKRKPVDLGYEIDIWALGITFYYLFFGNFPFYNENEFRLFNDIVANPIKFPSSISDCYLLRKVLNEPYNALNADYNLKLTKYFTHLCDLLKKMLIKDPEARIDMKGLKSHKLLTLFAKSKKNDDNNDNSKNYMKFNEEFLRKFNNNTDNLQDKKQNHSMVRHSKSNNLLNSYQEPVNSNSSDEAIRLKGTFAKIFASRSHQSSITDSSNTTSSDLDEGDTSFTPSYDEPSYNNRASGKETFTSDDPEVTNETASPSILHLINDSSISLPNLNSNPNPQKQNHDSHRHKVNDMSPQLNINLQTRERNPANRPFEYTKSFINEIGSHFDNNPTNVPSRTPSANSNKGSQRDSLITINTLPSKLSDALAPNIFQQKDFESSCNSFSDNSIISNTNSPISERFQNLSLSVSKDSTSSNGAGNNNNSGSKLVRSQANKGSLSKLKSSKRMNFQKVLDDTDADTTSNKNGMYTMDQYLNNL